VSTTFFLRNEAPPILGGASSGKKLLDDVRGKSAVSKVTTATVSGTNIPVTDTAGGMTLAWYSEPLQPVTISGTITVNLRGFESATTVNAGFGILLERTRADGLVLGTIIADTTVPGAITELSTSDAAVVGTYTPTSIAMGLGDRLKLTVKIRNVVTMAAGTVTLSIAGPTGGAAGDSFITFTETIRAYSDVMSSAWSGASQGGISGWW
jgi:hypothetical protein